MSLVPSLVASLLPRDSPLLLMTVVHQRAKEREGNYLPAARGIKGNVLFPCTVNVVSVSYTCWFGFSLLGGGQQTGERSVLFIWLFICGNNLGCSHERELPPPPCNGSSGTRCLLKQFGKPCSLHLFIRFPNRPGKGNHPPFRSASLRLQRRRQAC